METADEALWRRIERFELDDPQAALTFTQRLARENGWSPAFARRVVEEYKRFAYLAMTAGHEVTPSDEVDQAWHLHLTYTRSYWDAFCGEVLTRPLHHGPTKGGAREGERFEDQYERTLASYRAAFGQEPPADVWPPSSVRFGEAAAFVRVNAGRVWLVPKPSFGGNHRATASLACGLLALPPLAAISTSAFWGIVALVVVILLIVGAISRAARKGDDRNSGAGGGWFGGCGGGGWFGCGGDGGGCGGGGCGGGGCGGCGV